MELPGPADGVDFGVADARGLNCGRWSTYDLMKRRCSSSVG